MTVPTYTTTSFAGYYDVTSFDPTTGAYTLGTYYATPYLVGDDYTDTNLLDGCAGDGIELPGELLATSTATGANYDNETYTGYTIAGGPVTCFGGTQYYLTSNDPTLSGSGTATAGTFTYTCFLPGTLFATSEGLKPIEALQMGDLLQTAEGYRPLKWLGRREVYWNMAIPRRAAPILVKAGALGDGLPQRDLYCSPGHAFLIDGLLVNAELLVNGHSITQLLDYGRDFSYYNLELDSHAVVYAEGAAVETYLEVGNNRAGYSNAAEFHSLYPDHQPVAAMEQPRVTLKRQLPKRITEKLEQVACQLGFAQSRVA